MKWALIMILLGSTPVETGLVYDSIDACYDAEETARADYAKRYNNWRRWAQKNPKDSGWPASDEFMKQQITFGVCIPHGDMSKHTR